MSDHEPPTSKSNCTHAHKRPGTAVHAGGLDGCRPRRDGLRFRERRCRPGAHEHLRSHVGDTRRWRLVASAPKFETRRTVRAGHREHQNRKDSCFSYYTPKVQRSPGRIVIDLVEISRPEPSGFFCAGVAVGDPMVKVPLGSPYNGEELVEGADGPVRPLLPVVHPPRSEIVNWP